MNICILRHGTAEDRSPGVAEEGRRLTKEGRRELKMVLRQARAAGVTPNLILTSPLIRAVETAAMARDALACNRVVETKALLPDIAPAQVWREIRAQQGMKEIMLVGHEPQLSRIASFLL